MMNIKNNTLQKHLYKFVLHSVQWILVVYRLLAMTIESVGCKSLLLRLKTASMV